MRKVKITRNFLMHPEGSVLVEYGDTKVICTASVEEKVPPFLESENRGWVTAEYSMLPRATANRNRRDISSLKQSSRAVEIQRLIGRSLRAAVDMGKLGKRTITIDCDVIQADGGTRTASITGGYTALYDACLYLQKKGMVAEFPLKNMVAAVSVGIVDGMVESDLCYEKDSRADVDMNIVMNDKFEFIEIQGTGEKNCFNRKELDCLLDLAAEEIEKLFAAQKKSIGRDMAFLEKDTDSDEQ